MGHLLQMTSCPYCLQGNNTPCFAQYSDGYCCFSCGKKSSSSQGQRHYANKELEKELRVPTHSTRISEFAPHILEWLYKHYIFEDKIKQYRFGYVPYTKFTCKSGAQCEGEGLLMPVADNFFQCRFFQRQHLQ